MDDSHATLPVPSCTSRGEREAKQMYTREAAQVSGLLSCTICFFSWDIGVDCAQDCPRHIQRAKGYISGVSIINSMETRKDR